MFEGFQVKVNVRESDFVKNFIRNVPKVVSAPLQQRILQRYSFRTIRSFLQKDFLELSEIIIAAPVETVPFLV